MKCSKCQAENPEAKNFCKECGAKLLKAVLNADLKSFL